MNGAAAAQERQAVRAAELLLADLRRRRASGHTETNDADVEREARAALLANTKPPGWPAPLDGAAFYGLAGDLVRILAPHTEADEAALLTQFLAAFGNCVDRKPYYQVEADRHHANVYPVLVGESSKGRKGTSAGRIRGIFEGLADDDWAHTRIHSGLSSGEGVIWAVRDGLSDNDPGVTDKRLFVVEPEFATVLRVMMREGSILSRIIRDAWDRGDLATLTKNAPSKATNAHISIVGHVTADEIRRYLDRTEAANGFANRFLFICVRRARVLPFGGSPNESDLEDFSRRLAAAAFTAKAIGCVTMDAGAREAWAHVYGELSEGHPGLLGAVIGRAEAQVIRLALIYALLDGGDVIEVAHLLAALAVWQYAEESARFVFGETLGDPVADDIVRALGDGPKTRTQISSSFARHRSSAQLNRALALLEQLGRVRREEVGTRGRPAELWSLTTEAK